MLFDNAHSQTAGNADWTIKGGFSDFAEDIEKLGLRVEEWGDDEGRREYDDDLPITYEVLKKYRVFIIPEPNKKFSNNEKDSIIQYIEDGGSVFFIADHIGADRNNDGWDAVEIFNGFLKGTHNIESKTIYNDDFVGKLGFRFREKQYSEDPIINIKEHPITKDVNSTGTWAGTTEYIIDKENVHGIIYLRDESKGPYVIVGKYGDGKFVALGDTSPIDDGTGTPGDILHDGYYYGDNKRLMINIVKWLIN
ncbi:hypothetical protein JCM30566_16870 [Marinitoga arctica]